MMALSTAVAFSEPHVDHPNTGLILVPLFPREQRMGPMGDILTESPEQMELKVVSSVPFLLLIKSGTFEKSLPIRIKAWL